MPVRFKAWLEEARKRLFQLEELDRFHSNQATSEYQSHFTPVQSNNSISYTHTMKERAHTAGVTSEKLNYDNRTSIDCEPAFQRKKRTPAPATSLSSDFYNSTNPPADEYILLGNNEKFVENIRYRNRNINNCKNVGEFNFNRDVSPPKIQKTKSQKENIIPDQPPAPVVDTSAFRRAPASPSTPLAPREPKTTWVPVKTTEEKTLAEPPRKKVPPKTDDRDELRKNITRVIQKEKQAAAKKQPPVKRPTNPKMRTYVKPWVMSHARHDQKDPNTTAVPKLKVKHMQDQDTVSKEPQTEQKATSKDKPKLPVEEPIKGAITQEQEQATKDPNYGLKYKAGLSRLKHQGPTRLSEYQREFEWKNAAKSSPLMDAEQMVYNSHVTPANVKPDIIPKMSEYTAQFKEYPIVSEEDYLMTPQPGSGRPKHSAKVKRSKSTGALDNSQTCVADEVVSPDPKQTVGDDLKSKHGKYRKRVKSEYAVNFQAPWQYEYVDGAWKKASPPHIKQVEDEEPVTEHEPTTSWFQEVMELRQKALEYRKRAQGTHFSREHLVQLMARQAELWDQMSEGSRTLSALSLEAHASQSQRPTQVGDTEYGDDEDVESGVTSLESSPKDKSEALNSKVESRTYTKKQSLKHLAKKLEYSSGEKGTELDKNEEEEAGSDDPDLEAEEISPKARRSTKGRKPTQKTKSMKSGDTKKGKKKQSFSSKGVKSAWTQEEKETTRESNPEEDEGRIPTPTLRQRAVNQLVQRHHLDRTTPSVGGALLTSPPSQRKMRTSPPTFGSGYQSCEEDSDSDTLKNEPAAQRPVFTKGHTPVKKTFNFSKVNATQTFGRPSYDSHFLRDDSAFSDRPLTTKYVDTPQKLTSASDFQDATDSSEDARALPPSKHDLGVTYKRTDQSNNSRQPRPFSWSLDGGTFVPRRTYSEDDDDILSTSARSVASSSSLASEVLERAQRRNKDFWGRGASQRR